MHEHKEALIIRINPEVTVLSNPMTIDNRGDSYWWGGGYW